MNEENKNTFYSQNPNEDSSLPKQEENTTTSPNEGPSSFSSSSTPNPNPDPFIPTPPDYSWSGQPSSQQPAAAEAKKNGLKIFAVVMSVLFALSLGLSAFLLVDRFSGRGNDNSLSASDQTGQESSLPENENAPSLSIEDTPDGGTSTYADGGLSTEEIAAKVGTSVVGIEIYDNDYPLEAVSSGSGIIMTEDGYIITNSHVVSGADGIVVILSDETEYAAMVVGIDSKTDLAVIKVEAQGLPAAEFGDSDALKVGERIVAIGNPTGMNLAGSTTQGIVSGLQRSITLTNEETNTAITMEVIQVDAAINPGNSGGALINKYGQVVGINSAKVSSTQVEGIGFAIPINTAKPIVDDLIQYGYVKGRVLLGITYQAISDVVGQMYGYIPGLTVRSVDETMDAYAKGLRAGDVITKMDGIDVRDSDTVNEIMATKQPGDTITLTVIRRDQNGNTSTFEISPVLAEDRGTFGAVIPDENQSESQENQTEESTPASLPLP